ncbi:MAG: ribosome assembly cofactor RimP [Treponemataceae bacterium]|nr:ribosome assembly cofactor RimP [Treponemataceae bacterium]
MTYTIKEKNTLYASLSVVVQGLGLSLVDVEVLHQKGKRAVQVIISKTGGSVGIDDCSRVHRAIIPRLELAFPGESVFIEVLSPGINRSIKDASEFPLYVGKGVRCYVQDKNDWCGGVIVEADDTHLVLRKKGELVEIPYENIVKARLDHSQEVAN